ncbi:PREDICTED: uncharacterized protein LOC105556030 [Vollenhovia emeryi]|uniref:uncharacterized protein LOC105556030 n=1 Tax=Vollenhovia emeryi TaxID=411798 RepID=UPI0005F3B671|nr:PREDICTED: uncharacterized protein LOC105556030 [Vollenhovia emeryi]
MPKHKHRSRSRHRSSKRARSSRERFRERSSEVRSSSRGTSLDPPSQGNELAAVLREIFSFMKDHTATSASGSRQIVGEETDVINPSLTIVKSSFQRSIHRQMSGSVTFVDPLPESNDSNKENECLLASELFGLEQPPSSAEAWDPIILSATKNEVRSGLKEELRSALLTKHELKGDLQCLGPPKMNGEVISALSKRQSVLKRDDYQVKEQKQVGACLSAIGTGISDLLKARRELTASEKEAVSKMADGMHLLADHQYRLSLTRQALVKPCLAFIGKSAANRSTVDDWLFGENFEEGVKSAQALEKTGRELSKAIPAQSGCGETHQPTAPATTDSPNIVTTFGKLQGPCSTVSDHGSPIRDQTEVEPPLELPPSIPLTSTSIGDVRTAGRLYNFLPEWEELIQDSEVLEAIRESETMTQNQHEESLQQLQNINAAKTSQENDSVFKRFICDQETRPEVGRKLASLLITPVQRVPRYQLLVKQVLQHTPYDHREHRHLQACLVEIEKSAKHINTLIVQNEETQKLLNLQKCIVTSINLVKPGRILIKQGSLMRVSRRGNSAYRRYFVLLNDTLLYCKGEPETSLNISCVLPLNKCSLTCVLSKKLFRITCLHETFLLYSEKDDSNEWIQSIQSAIRKYTECRQTLRKESSSRKPLRHKNINQFSSDDIPAKSVKRKRCVKDEEVLLDTSNIIYFKKDNEMDEDVQSSNTCLPLFTRAKRFKQDEYSKDGYIAPAVKSTKLKSCRKRNERYTPTHRCFKKSSNCNYNETLSTTTGTHGTSVCPVASNAEKHTSPFQGMSEFFTFIGTTIKDLFTFR